MTAPRVSLRAAAALFLERQHLDRPRRRRFTRASLDRFVSDTGGLQLDSINVVERAHLLTTWSRFGPFDRAAFDRLAYRERVLFEYWAHAACLISTTQFAPWRRAMLDYNLRHRAWASWLKKNAAVLREVERAIVAAGGPLGNADFEHRRPPGSAAGWWNWKPATHALDYLWMSGRTLIHSRTHFQKRFDLAKRVMPEALTLEPPSAEEFRRWHVRRSLHAMGAATGRDLSGYLTFPRAEIADRRKALKELHAAGEVVEIVVEHGGRGVKGPWFALASDLPALTAAGRRRTASRGTTFLSPFDSFLWHRERTRRLFGFDYRIEVYTPGPKRVHGYYVLPILHDGQLIGRADLKNHRSERRLEVRKLSFEDWFVKAKDPPAANWGPLDRDAALSGVAGALRSLAAFTGATTIEIGPVRPSRLRSPLRAAVAAATVSAAVAEPAREDATASV